MIRGQIKREMKYSVDNNVHAYCVQMQDLNIMPDYKHEPYIIGGQMKRDEVYSVDMVGVRICGTWWENGLRRNF